jgi:hypothetical protein
MLILPATKYASHNIQMNLNYSKYLVFANRQSRRSKIQNQHGTSFADFLLGVRTQTLNVVFMSICTDAPTDWWFYVP